MVITIDVPEGGHPLLKMGQKVDLETPMLEAKTEEKTELHIAKELKQYGNVVSYQVNYIGDNARVRLELEQDFDKFAKFEIRIIQ